MPHRVNIHDLMENNSKNFVKQPIFLVKNCIREIILKRVCVTGEQRKIVVWEDSTKSWGQLREKERKQTGAKRACIHEKQLKYQTSLEENIQNLQEMYEFCHEKGIKMFFCMFPFTEEYLNGMSLHYVQTSKAVINKIKEYCDIFIELNDKIDLETEDLVDCDHLSDTGCQKITKLIKEVLQ